VVESYVETWELLLFEAFLILGVLFIGDLSDFFVDPSLDPSLEDPLNLLFKVSFDCSASDV